MKTPLEQIKNGLLPKNVVCKDGLKLIFKFTDSSPACVSPGTKTKLIERGWGLRNFVAPLTEIYDLETQNGVVHIRYNDRIHISQISEESNSTSLLLALSNSKPGILTLAIPNNLVDTLTNYKSFYFKINNETEEFYYPIKTPSHVIYEIAIIPEYATLRIIGQWILS